jgi:DNA-binding winged helix-turn-helix (wHTH) protein
MFVRRTLPRLQTVALTGTCTTQPVPEQESPGPGATQCFTLSLDSGPLRFGLFELDPVNGELRRRGLRVRLTPQAMTLLCLLVERPIRMRTREEIQRRLWPGNTFVDFERRLNKAVHSLREGLGDSATNPRFIETVAAQGYRFLPVLMEESGWVGETRSRDGLEYIAVLPIVAGMEADLVFRATGLLRA